MWKLLLVLSGVALGHGSHKHTEKSQEKNESLKLMAINSAYLETVKPIFTKKCFDCHSDQTTFPWYYKIPGVKQLIDEDVSEAKEHLDLSKDFPFAGHGTPEKDLEEINKVILKKKMPPWRYWIIHWESQLTEEERRLVSEWTTQSIELLEKK